MRCVHSNIRSFQCYICDKRFRDNFGLKRHVKEAHKVATNENDTGDNKLDETDENKENEAPTKTLRCAIHAIVDRNSETASA